jgi:tRNA uridine 5-carboxymethylaminomethyl modification enzyme
LDNNRPSLTRAEALSVEVHIKYEGYINRQLAEVAKQERLETRSLPQDLDYSKITGLRIEAAQKLQAIRPLTIGQASRISGVSPADISVLLIYLDLKNRRRTEEENA